MPNHSALLARMLLLLCAICLAARLLYGPGLRPHYLMPLFPVPALVLGLLAGYRMPGTSMRPWRLPASIQGASVWRALVALVALALGVSNARHLWQAGFMPDADQVTLLPDRSNRITLGQMREASAYIAQTAGARRFNVLFAAPDDQGYAYEALLLSAHARLSGRPAALRFLIVQPPGWDAGDWPAWARPITSCALAPPAHFAAALVWTLPGAMHCPASRPAVAENPPRVGP